MTASNTLGITRVQLRLPTHVQEATHDNKRKRGNVMPLVHWKGDAGLLECNLFSRSQGDSITMLSAKPCVLIHYNKSNQLQDQPGYYGTTICTM